jgi:hypothetical protein
MDQKQRLAPSAIGSSSSNLPVIRMLLAARGRRRRRCCSGCWGFFPGQHPDLPNIALTRINHSPIALDWYRFAGLDLSCLAPFSGRPQRIAIRTYQVRSVPIELDHMGFGVPPLVRVCIMACRPMTGPVFVTKTPSSVKSAAMTAGSFLISPSSYALPIARIFWVVSGSGASFCWANVGKAKLIANHSPSARGVSPVPLLVPR